MCVLLLPQAANRQRRSTAAATRRRIRKISRSALATEKKRFLGVADDDDICERGDGEYKQPASSDSSSSSPSNSSSENENEVEVEGQQNVDEAVIIVEGLLPMKESPRDRHNRTRREKYALLRGDAYEPCINRRRRIRQQAVRPLGGNKYRYSAHPEAVRSLARAILRENITRQRNVATPHPFRSPRI